MADKSGAWFLELILNVLLLAGVAWVTFAARGEQERGLAVPLFAAVSPLQNPSPANLPANATTPAAPAIAPLAPATTAAPAVPSAMGQTFSQAFGALQVWAAGLDGKITAAELKKIQDSLITTWNSTQTARDYLKSVNERINSGQSEAVISEALKALGQQARDKQVLVMNTVVQYMKDNGITWEQTKILLNKWTGEALKLSPAELLELLKP